MAMKSFKQGVYEIQNWDKYIGTKKPTYRSSYEYEFFRFLDRAPAIIKWGAEMVVVPYNSSVKGRMARYYVDIYVKYETRQGEIKEEIIEIKPYAQTLPPKKGRGKKADSTYATAILTYTTNLEKWTAAKQYAKERGWNFRILTENSIFK